jgi:hypothetical protein
MDHDDYPPAPEPAPPRATTPHLDARCVAGIGGENPACGWDPGFPAIWQRRFDVDAQFTPQASQPDDENCAPSREHTEGIAWDVKTRTILAQVLYSGGGDSCEGTPIDYVVRLP